MPLYTYRCDHCGVQFERRQGFNDRVLRKCPECGERALRKLYLPVGIVFKGSGFYSTDHRRSTGMSSSTSETNGSKEKSEGKKASEESKATSKEE